MMKAPDITKDPTLYVVPYAHLDTQWRWEFPQTISDVAAGRWYPAGSSVEEGDVNLPSAEGIFRQILYGNEYFRKDFGKASAEYMLPDCFGFPALLPSILAHAGVKGFSTQKLNSQWQPAAKIGGPGSPEDTPEGIPFNVGMWLGPDGKGVIAALNPGGYGSNVYGYQQGACGGFGIGAATDQRGTGAPYTAAGRRGCKTEAAGTELGQACRPERKSHWHLC
jgi:alpha-mannosidase